MANGWTDFSKAAIWRRRFTDVYSTHAVSDDVVAKVRVSDLDVFRASSGYVRLKDGTIRSLGTDAVRSGFEYNNATGLYERAVRLEPQRTNGFTTYSTDLSQAAWVKVGVLSTTMAATGPDGVANSACHLVEDTSTGVHSVVRACAFTAGRVQSCSVWLRPFGPHQRPWRLKWEMASPYTDAMGVEFYPATQTIAPYARGASAVAIVQCVQGSGGLWRVQFSGILNAASTTGSITVQGIDPGVSASYTGDGVSGVDVYNVQPETDAAFSSSDMPTAASGVTRAADLASVDLAGTAVDTPGESTYYIRFIEGGHILASSASGALPRIFQRGLKSPTAGQGGVSVFAQSGYYRARLSSSAAYVDAAMSAAPVPGDQVELLVNVSPSGAVTLTQAINGAVSAPVAGSSTVALEAAFSDAKLYVNASDASGNDAGAMALKNLLVSSGTYDMGTMRELANE